MITFKESLNSSLPYEIYIWTGREAIFSVDRTWKVTFRRRGVSGYERITIDFEHVYHGMDSNGEYSAGKAFAVYATIGNVLEKYVREYPCMTIEFIALSSQMQPIYKRLAKQIASKLGMQSGSSESVFMVYRDDD